MKLINSNSGVIVAIWILFFGSISIGIDSEPISKPLMNFYDASIARQWLSVNDNVMGGVSDGSFRITDDKTLEFSGNLSLENRGGFASIRTRPTDLKLEGYGRTYYFNLRTSSRNAAGSYRAPVKTQKQTWQEVRIPLKTSSIQPMEGE